MSTKLLKSIIYRLFVPLLVGLFGLASAYAEPTSATSPEQFLQNQNLIRVCLSTGPGMGDQANSANVMNRLRQLGYKGKFEVVYEKYVMPAVTAVFNLPADITDDYVDQATSTRFIELTTYNKLIAENKIDLVNFAFGMGKIGLSCDDDNVHAKSFASFLPYYNREGGDNDATSIDIIGKRSFMQKDSGKKYLVSPIASYDDAKAFLQNNPVGQDVVTKKPALNEFISGIDNQKYNVLFEYGFTLQMEGNYRQPHVHVNTSNILQTLLGARYAQLHGPADLKKPLIVAVFYDYNKDSAELISLMNSDNWGTIEVPGAAEARAAIKEMKLGDVLSIADISDPQTINKIKSLKNGQILLLSLGSMPKTVFDGLYNHTAPNILPPVREGAGTFNSLVTTGRPSFECAWTGDQDECDPSEDCSSESSWTAGFGLVDDESLKQTLVKFYDSRKGYCAIETDSNDKFYYLKAWQAKTYETVGQLIIEANNPNSAYSRYFKNLQADVLNPANDRVRYALQAIAKQLGKPDVVVRK